MKHISIWLLCLLAWGASSAQDGVNFRDITLEEALRQAKAENKLVFMDCYTSWCGPCKNMTEKIFPQKAAGDYFNPRFVCVKYDLEKGAGKELASLIEKRLPEMSVETLKTYAFGFRGIVWGSEEKTVPPHIVKVGTRLTKSVIADLERRTTQLTAEELHTYTILMDSFYGEMTPALYRRLADAGEKALAALPESKEKEYSALYFKACRKKAGK